MPDNELLHKLGLKPDVQAFMLYPPANYLEILAGAQEVGINSLPNNIDWLIGFYLDISTLRSELPTLVEHLAKTGQLWLCWPKRTSKIETDLSDSSVRELGLSAGLVDVKIVSVDEAWSALKFVYRLKDR